MVTQPSKAVALASSWGQQWREADICSKYLWIAISNVPTQTVCVKSHLPDIVTQEMLNAAGTLAAPFYVLLFGKPNSQPKLWSERTQFVFVLALWCIAGSIMSCYSTYSSVCYCTTKTIGQTGCYIQGYDRAARSFACTVSLLEYLHTTYNMLCLVIGRRTSRGA